jgi:hypothetical protein
VGFIGEPSPESISELHAADANVSAPKATKTRFLIMAFDLSTSGAPIGVPGLICIPEYDGKASPLLLATAEFRAVDGKFYPQGVRENHRTAIVKESDHDEKLLGIARLQGRDRRGNQVPAPGYCPRGTARIFG